MSESRDDEHRFFRAFFRFLLCAIPSSVVLLIAFGFSDGGFGLVFAASLGVMILGAGGYWAYSIYNEEPEDDNR